MQQYTIEPNDTLFLIAKKYKIPLAQLIQANPDIANPNLLYIGQTIIIPDLLPIPKQLDTIDSNTEDIMDDIYAKDWQKSKNKINTIKTNWNELIPLLQQALVPDNLISDLGQAINNLEQSVIRENSLQAIAQANHVTQYIPGILDYFKVIIPTDVNRLDYLGRQIIINVEGNEWASANNTYVIAKKVWERLKPELDAKYGNDSANFEKVLNILHDTISRRDYQATIDNANKILDQVDVLETDFKQQNA